MKADKRRMYEFTTRWLADGELHRQVIGIEATGWKEALRLAKEKYPGREISANW